MEVVFSYDLATHVLTVSTRTAGATPDLTAGEGPVAAARPGRLGRARRRPAPLPPALVGRRRPGRRRRGRLGGSTGPLTHDPAGLPADVLADFPHLDGYEAFRLRPRRPRARCRQILRGQVAVASYDRERRRSSTRPGVQIPGVLDDVYAAATAPRPRRDVDGKRPADARRSGRRPPRTSTCGLADRVPRARSPMERQADGTWTVDRSVLLDGRGYLFDVHGLVAVRAGGRHATR